MRHGITISAVLHGVVIALALLGLPDWWRRPLPVVENAVVVDLVKVADVTTPRVKPEPKPEPEPEPVQEEKVKAEEPPPEPPKPAPPPEPVEAEAPPPPPPPPPPEPEPVQQPEPKPEPPKPEVAKLETPKPEFKPKVKPEPKPEPKAEKQPEPETPPSQPAPKKTPDEPEFDPNRLAALLDKRAEAAPEQAEQPAKKTESKPPEQETRKLGEALTISEVDAIRAQIQRCWSVPAGARNAEDLVVRIKVFLRPDGSLARPPEILDEARMSLDGQEYFRTAAESARRAVLRCSPLQDLPQAKYERWRELTLTFDPKEMVSG